MQLKLETPVLDDHKAEAEEAAVKPRLRSDRDDGLLGTAIPIMIAAYATSLGIVTFTFWQSGDAMLSIAICAVYIVMFFGVPIVMARIRNRHDQCWRSDRPEVATDHVTVFTGPIGRTQALLQILIVPLAAVLAFAAFSAIWLTMKP